MATDMRTHIYRPRFVPKMVPLDDSDLVNELQEVFIRVDSWAGWQAVSLHLDMEGVLEKNICVDGQIALFLFVSCDNYGQSSTLSCAVVPVTSVGMADAA